jgi:acyl-CoA synthetase (AMP-forming)/AMP-acid ligase II
MKVFWEGEEWDGVMPLTGSGKVMKFKLREWAEQRVEW